MPADMPMAPNVGTAHERHDKVSQPTTFSVTASRYGRIGLLHLPNHHLPTPLLFPVASLITGTTARGGGLWKYILQAHPYGLMRRQIPIMTQVLHFLDFSVSSQSIQAWRTKTLREHYNQGIEDLRYKAPLFADSGGFKLLWGRELDLSAYGIQANPATILSLQKDLGSDLIATLDYPLPPGLERTEAEERMRKSRENAISTLRLLKAMPTYQPQVFIAVHGQDSQDICHYVQHIFDEIEAAGLGNLPLGIAIGSLVPLRGAGKTLAIIQMIQGALAGIPPKYKDRVPVHVFGMTGNMVPLLAYLGVDTFDSSTYAQEARSLGYFDPQTYRSQPVLELEELRCDCRICREINLIELQDALVSTPPPHRPLPNGLYKSKYYADVALHNLEMDFRVLRQTRMALKADALQEYLIQHCERFPQLQKALQALAASDEQLQTRITRTTHPLATQRAPFPRKRRVSLKYTPNSFNILSNGYHPPEDKHILLVIPCSGGKPYSSSRSHRLIKERLAQALGEGTGVVHKVTLSGLYGPVPEEYENEPVVLGYDFRLDPIDTAQINLVTDRLAAYLNRFGGHYAICLGYATSRAYRTVLEQVAKQAQTLQVLPTKLKSRRLTEFFRGENIVELVERVTEVLQDAVTQ